MFVNKLRVHGLNFSTLFEREKDGKLLESNQDSDLEKTVSLNAGKRVTILATYFVEKVILYMLMLLVMTYNGYVILSVVAGLTIGYNFTLLK